MSAESAHLSTFGAETENEAEIRSTSTPPPYAHGPDDQYPTKYGGMQRERERESLREVILRAIYCAYAE